MNQENKAGLFRRVKPRSKEERVTLTAAVICGLILLALDQLTKLAVVECLELHSLTPVIPGFFDISSVRNFGAAWGIFSGRGWMLLIVAAAAAILICCYFRKICEGWTERYYALFFILSGIVGNSIDRIFRGSVVDFLRFYWRSWEWPSFNIADSAICVGVCIFVLSTLLRPEEKKSGKAGKNSKAS